MKHIKISKEQLSNGSNFYLISDGVLLFWGIDIESKSIKINEDILDFIENHDVAIDEVAEFQELSDFELFDKYYEFDSPENTEAVSFLNWCNTPVYKDSRSLGFKLRVQPQYPEYNTYLVIDSTGYSVLPAGKFLTAAELYEYWLSSKV